MSIKESILNNTVVKDGNYRGGFAISPLSTEILSKSTKPGMFSKVAFDYLAFTFPYSKFEPENLDYFMELLLLKQEPYKDSAIGGNGYGLSLRWKNQIDALKETETKFFYNCDKARRNQYGEDTGFFELQGEGCRALERRGGDRFPHYWYTILNSVLMSVPHTSITRFDFAIDVFNSEISMKEINRQIRLGNVETSAINCDIDDGFNLKNFETYLHIICLGSTKSDRYLEIYDKKEERESIGKTVDFDSWYRFEFRFKGKEAKKFILNLLENWDLENDSIGNFAAEYLNKNLTLRLRPKQGKNAIPDDQRIIVPNDIKRKWKIHPSWLALVGTSEKAVLVNYFKYESSITKNAEWFSSSVSVTFAKLFCANPDKFWVFVYKALNDGVCRIKDKKEALALVNDYRKKNGDHALNGHDLDEISNKFELKLDDLVESSSEYGDIFNDDGRFGMY